MQSDFTNNINKLASWQKTQAAELHRIKNGDFTDKKWCAYATYLSDGRFLFGATDNFIETLNRQLISTGSVRYGWVAVLYFRFFDNSDEANSKMRALNNPDIKDELFADFPKIVISAPIR